MSKREHIFIPPDNTENIKIHYRIYELTHLLLVCYMGKDIPSDTLVNRTKIILKDTRDSKSTKIQQLRNHLQNILNKAIEPKLVIDNSLFHEIQRVLKPYYMQNRPEPA